MKNRLLFIAILILITLSISCSKENIILNEEYLTVSDIFHYCNVPCSEKIEWEGKEVKVKGHIHNYMLDNEKKVYCLIDIRNSNYIEIYVDSSCIDAVFNKITSSNIMNTCYITGTLQSFEMCTTMFKCDVGAIILLNSVNDIYFK
jgi:hypothetical protein